MRTRHTDPRRMRRCRVPVLILFLCAAPSSAQVPQSTIERIVALNIQATENQYLLNSGQIDNPAWTLRQNGIDAELKTLSQQFRQFSADDQKQADNEIQGLVRARLATLKPQWEARADAFKRQGEQHDRTVIDTIRTDARTALEPQRRRLLLQQRRDRGEITAEDFAAEDKRALDEIMAIRGKYASEGQRYVDSFDHELELLTQAIAKDPATTLPVSQVQTGQGGTSGAGYQRRVALAADLSARWNEVRNRYWVKKEIPSATLRESERIFSTDLSRLSEKWRVAGRGNDFERDYRQQLARVLLPVPPPKAVQGKAAQGKATQGKAAQGSRAAAVDAQFRQPQEWLAGRRFVFIIVAGIMLLCLTISLLRKKIPERGTTGTYGTAHYAPQQLDIADEMCLARGLFLGKSSAPELTGAPLEIPGAPVCSTPEHHTLIVARTRTGKGTRVIVPTLLRYAGSAFVIDPKGENAAITARARSQMVQGDLHWVRILNPWNVLDNTFQEQNLGVPATYNPLDILDRSDPDAVAVAQTLASAICPAPANAKDRFWQGSAANILTAVFLWLADQAEVTGERKTLARAREIISLSRKDFTDKYLIPMAASEEFSGAIQEMAAPYIDLAPETYSGIMSNLSENTKFLSDPQVKAATATSSFSMNQLATHKSTVYVVIPTDRMETQKTWLRLVVAAAMHAFKRPRKRGEARHRCLFLIDEFAALGHMDDMPRDISTMSGFGVDFALVVQGLNQLKDHYGEARNEIINNCAYQWFCNLNDLDSAKYLSDVLGKKTVVTTSTSHSTSSGTRSSSDSDSKTQGETGRNLLNPDEILNLGRDVAILVQPKGRPHYLRPVDYWNLPKAFARLRKEHPSLYWEPPLRYDKNPYVEPPPPPPPPPGSKRQRAESKEKARSDPPPSRAKMTHEDAREILGVKVGATLEEIRAAYLNLIKKIHPDHGGSSYFAKQLNAAKDLLMGQ